MTERSSLRVKSEGDRDSLSRVHTTDRRTFLKSVSGAVAAGAVSSSISRGTPRPVTRQVGGASRSAATSRKIPIGVFNAAYKDLSLDAMLEKISALGLEAIEIGTGGYSATPHCQVDELLSDSAKFNAWKKKFEDRKIVIAALSCHGNPIHPDETIAHRDDDIFRSTVLLAERLGVKVIVGFSGCPAANPTDKSPSWIAYSWPGEYATALDWQWNERLIPYWKQAAAFARQHGIRRIAFEMHPNFCVYNPKTLLKLRDAVGEEIGANCDLSHLFWQECDPVEVIHLLGKQGAIFHAHMKDTVLYKENVERYGVLNFAFDKKDIPQASANFRAVGYGHGAELWKEIVRAYMDVGYEGILSIENEDPLLSGEVGVERAAYVLKNVRAELLASAS